MFLSESMQWVPLSFLGALIFPMDSKAYHVSKFSLYGTFLTLYPTPILYKLRICQEVGGNRLDVGIL